MSSSSSGEKSVRVNIILSQELHIMLMRIADRQGVKVTEVIRHALSLERWFNDDVLDTDSVLARKSAKGEVFEVDIPYA